MLTKKVGRVGRCKLKTEASICNNSFTSRASTYRGVWEPYTSTCSACAVERGHMLSDVSL